MKTSGVGSAVVREERFGAASMIVQNESATFAHALVDELLVMKRNYSSFRCLQNKNSFTLLFA